ncbi:Uma2 family endonuclease [Roseomonas genomospecies 6]|uniref:Uma2 family endonuclease n=1 Tax=Roseomonas genomospecies 6 TaxID=214106 RepID=A0A9W7NMF4_9PROT|nr:Uma2 family endonuclease [Roseomonas genomospecies 6]KAA0682944.1 Uma2 family endonuclease [Roseomonas genomospecies 6]
MGMTDPAPRPMTVEEFLVWDDGTDTRYELVGGQPVAMAPPSDAHALLAANVVVEFGKRLRPPCRARVEAGILLPDRDDAWFQADVAVGCGPTSSKPGTVDPTIIVEILSPSTAQFDRGRKLAIYREIPSVQEILLLDSTKRCAELWHREDEQSWVVRDIIGGGTLRFPSVGIEIPMAALYEGVL